MGSITTRRVLGTAAISLSLLVVALLVAWALYPSLPEEGGVGSASKVQAGPLLSSIPTATASPSGPLLTGLPSLPPAVATIQPTSGITTVVTIPGSQGNVSIPNDAAGDVALQVSVRPVASPTAVPAGLTLLSAIQISFTSLTDSTAVRELNEDVTIEISYAGRGLTDDQINRLVIYNANRNEFLTTTTDAARLVAIAKTKRFSTFTLARISGPIPTGYIPSLSKEFSGAW